MKLKTLIQYQAAFNTMKIAEKVCRQLTPEEYVACVSAKSMFDFELDIAMRGDEVAVTNTEAS